MTTKKVIFLLQALHAIPLLLDVCSSSLSAVSSWTHSFFSGIIPGLSLRYVAVQGNGGVWWRWRGKVEDEEGQKSTSIPVLSLSIAGCWRHAMWQHAA